MKLKAPEQVGMAATFASIPWCCILPGVLSLVSLSGVVATRLWLVKLSFFLFPVSGALLCRALWLVHVRHQGRPWARWATWGAMLLVMVLWAPRLWSWFLA